MSLIQRALKSLRNRGLTATMDSVLCVIEDRVFDWRYSTSTGGYRPLRDLSIQSDNAAHGVNYYPSRIRPFRRLMRSLNLSSENGFVDYGSGKGRVLLAAALMGFQRVVGVEFSPELCQVARQNLQGLQRKLPEIGRVQIIDGDAALYAVHPEDTVFYFFHPFDSTVMEKVVDNIRQSLLAHQRQAYIIYHYPRCREVIEKSGLFKVLTSPVLDGEQYVVYTNAAG